MLDPVIEFFTRIFFLMGRAVGTFIAWLLWPFVALAAWYKKRGWILRSIVGGILLFVMLSYGWFLWNALYTRGYDINYTAALDLNDRKVSAGEQVAPEAGTDTTRSCGPSAIVEVSQALINGQVDENMWLSATLIYKLGLFGIPWDATPWMDNKATFQRGVIQSVKTVTLEMRERIGRLRGTSQSDPDLEDALSNINIDPYNWYVGLNPIGAKQTAWGSYRQASKEFAAYNARLSACDANFDARADSLSSYLDRIAKDIGSTSAVIKDRSEQYNGGWFDMRADNVFMQAHGQLYGYLGLLRAARVDFDDIIRQRAIGNLWDNMESQLVSALELDPAIISNGKEDGWLMPTHLTTMGFYILRVRTNLTEMRDVLQD